MSKKQIETCDESNGVSCVKKKKKDDKRKSFYKYATNEQIVKYCIDNDLLYALMIWLEIDLKVSILRGGVIKPYKTALNTDGYYFVSLDPNKKRIIKEIEISKTEYEDYLKSLTNELSVYLSESEYKPASAKKMFGQYVYAKLNHKKCDEDIELEAFIHHIKKFTDIETIKVAKVNNLISE